MPELPEVETIRLQLEKYVVGQRIQDIEVRRQSIIHGDTAIIHNQTIIAARRFSKLLVLDTDGGSSIAIHLKMTGRLIYSEKPERKKQVSQELAISHDWEIDYQTNPHTHVILIFTSGAKLYFNDYRRFGTIDVIKTNEIQELPYLKNLGKEFFVDLTAEEFKKVLSSTSRAIKVVLLDQSKIAGVGNIYANEALWRVKLDPETPAKAISAVQGQALHGALEQAMKEALARHGASSDDFRDLFGRKGQAQNYFDVYGRVGKPCPRCQTHIIKFFVGGRGTYICPECQKKNSEEKTA